MNKEEAQRLRDAERWFTASLRHGRQVNKLIAENDRLEARLRAQRKEDARRGGAYRAVYHRIERAWYLWDGHDAIEDEHGSIRLFTTAGDAYEWLATGA